MSKIIRQDNEFWLKIRDFVVIVLNQISKTLPGFLQLANFKNQSQMKNIFFSLGFILNLGSENFLVQISNFLESGRKNKSTLRSQLFILVFQYFSRQRFSSRISSLEENV